MPSLPGFDELFVRADTRHPVAIVAAGGADATVLQALAQAARRGWVKPTVTGDESAIVDLAGSLDIDLGLFRVIHSNEPAMAAVAEIHAGRAALLMKGQIATPELMRAVLHSETGLRTGKTICQIVLMEISRDQRCFLLADTGITIEPTVQQLREIVEGTLAVARNLGNAQPRIALMAATEKENEAMPETMLAGKLRECGELRDMCILEGPLSFDLAYSNEAGARKRLAGEAVGRTDVMIFPNLLSANLTVKAIMYTADSRFGGVLWGTTVPVVFMSRADSVETRLRSIGLALSLCPSSDQR